MNYNLSNRERLIESIHLLCRENNIVFCNEIKSLPIAVDQRYIKDIFDLTIKYLDRNYIEHDLRRIVETYKNLEETDLFSWFDKQINGTKE